MQRKSIYKIIGMVVVFILAVYFINQIKGNETIQNLVQEFGYAGVFLLAFLSGFNVVIPLPAISFLPIFHEAGMSTTTVIALISMGMTLGDSLGYFLGFWGRKIFLKDEIPGWLTRLEAKLERHKFGLPLFMFLYASFGPFPNELVVIPSGAAHQKWWAVLIPIFFGNLVLNTLLAYGITDIFL